MKTVFLGALAVSLLLPLYSGAEKENGYIKAASFEDLGSGYWGNIILEPVYKGHDYELRFRYSALYYDTHTFSVFWTNSLTNGSEFTVSYLEGQKEVVFLNVFSSEEWSHKKIELEPGEVIDGSFTIPSYLIDEQNQLFLLDKRDSDGIDHTLSSFLIPSSPVSEIRADLLSVKDKKLVGPTSYHLFEGHLKPIVPTLSFPALSDVFVAKDDLVPLHSILFSSLDSKSEEAYSPPDSDLTLRIKGHDLSLFPYEETGFEEIALPCRFKKSGDEGGYCVELVSQEVLSYPKSGDYSFSIENNDSEVYGRYGFTFSLERESPYIGGCLSGEWCVEVS